MTFLFLMMDVMVVCSLKFSASSSKITCAAVFNVLSQPSTVIILVSCEQSRNCFIVHTHACAAHSHPFFHGKIFIFNMFLP